MSIGVEVVKNEVLAGSKEVRKAEEGSGLAPPPPLSSPLSASEADKLLLRDDEIEDAIPF